jgi:hypothetical protein
MKGAGVSSAGCFRDLHRVAAERMQKMGSDMKVALAVILSVAGVLMVLSACSSGDNQTTVPSATSTATSTPTSAITTTPSSTPVGGGGGDAPSPTVVAPSPILTSSVPADWKTHATLSGTDVVTVRFPSTWYDSPGGGIQSWDVSTTNPPRIPPGATKIDLIYGLSSQAEQRPAGGVDATVAGRPGWQAEYKYASGGFIHVREVAIVNGDKTAFVVAMYSAPESPDEADIFAKMVSSLTFS